MRARLLMIGAAMVVAPALLVGCGSSSKSKSSTQPTGGGLTVASTTTAGAATTVNVVLGDTAGLKGKMTMVVNPTTAPAGKVTFTVKNNGTITHELIVLKTPTASDKLPISDAGDPPAPVTSGANKVSETTSAGETGDVAKGETKSVTLDLTAGSYVLVCNIAQHYGLGMRAAFTVS
jgi:uncharacterized cupredoxin-like copper-binding protein